MTREYDINTLQSLLVTLRKYKNDVEFIRDSYSIEYRGLARYTRCCDFCNKVNKRIAECNSEITKYSNMTDEYYNKNFTINDTVRIIAEDVNRTLAFDYKRLVEIGVFITRYQAIAIVQSTIDKIEYFKSQIKQILGSDRDSECRDFIGTCSRYISEYVREKRMYEGASDEQFLNFYPTMTFRNINMNLRSLEITTNTLVARGPRYNP